MENEKQKSKTVSKKELIRTITNLDTNNLLDGASLIRTNIPNLKAIIVLLKAEIAMPV